MNILWIPHAPWHVPQREHYLLQALAQTYHVVATDWDTDFRRLADYVSSRYVRNFIPTHFHDRGVTVYHAPRVSPALYFTAVRRYNDRLYQHTLAHIVRKHQIDWVIGSFVVPYQDLGVPVSIDVGDDNVAYWLEGGGPSDYAREIQINEDSWIRASQHVTVVSNVLRERLQSRIPRTTPVTVIPNGVDLKTYVPVRDRGPVKRALGLNPSHHYIACIGSLNRVNEMKRLLALARRIQTEPSVSLVLVGTGAMIPVLRAQIDKERLQRVILAGFQTDVRLLQYFQACEVGLCPYRVTPGLQAAAPLRLLQYSAVGATVVIPVLEEVQKMGFSNVLFCHDSDDNFVETAIQALDVPGHVPPNINAYDWGHLANELAEVLLPKDLRQR
ncbi:MAG: hypothetical protein C7B45_01310 [Sulfobacillus acidophilus]|uniref:Glycosyltransferase subfamily 4-like N-terminal domain-containing protein n=1 Tax=Sulfobacillus acidophilus TaxID=53633 RepID=A0A2T2WNX4_9FIRM|nr:MAG: hypothetical protein C7B45_01310 [Sulfobacillus acidophilus]